MRILVTSTFYPPVALGGYEVECAGVVERLREQHEVLVLTCDQGRGQLEDQSHVRRELSLLSPNASGALRAPLAARRAVASAHEALAWGPELDLCLERLLDPAGGPARACGQRRALFGARM